MSWTNERVASLRALWAKGRSASQIADELGGVSRNGVIGKAHRLGLEARPSPIITTSSPPATGPEEVEAQRARRQHQGA